MGEEEALSCSSPLAHAHLDPRQRLAHRAGPHRFAFEVAADVAGLGLPVAVGGLEARRLAEGGDGLGLQRLAGGDHAAQGGERAQRGALGQHPVLGRRLAEHVDAERLGQVEPLGGVEAPGVDRRRGAGQPGGEEDVAGRLRPARRGRTPDQLAGARGEPVLGLGALPVQVAVGVDDAPRLAGRAGGEDDQRRVLGAHLLDRGGRLLGAVLVEHRGDILQRHRRYAVRQLGEQLRFADAERRRRGAHPQLEVVAAQLRAAGQGDRAHAPAGEQRQRPLDPVAEQRHHHVAAPHPARREGAGEPGRASDQLTEVPVPPLARGVDRDDPQPRGRRALHQLDEVHARQVCRMSADIRQGICLRIAVRKLRPRPGSEGEFRPRRRPRRR